MDKCEASAQIARRRLVLLRQQLGGYQDDKPLDLVVYYVPSTHRKVWGRGVPSGRSLLSQNPLANLTSGLNEQQKNIGKIVLGLIAFNVLIGAIGSALGGGGGSGGYSV